MTHLRLGATLVLTAALTTGPLFGGTAFASPADGMVVGTTKIYDSGPASDRFNLVLMGDGYRESELGTFAAHADQFVQFMLNTPPFSTNCSAINVYRVDVKSTDSGADDPASPGDDPMTPADESQYCQNGTGASVATYFDSSFCFDGIIRRLLSADGAIATNVANAEVPEWDQVLVIVNDPVYGGAGGDIGTTSVSGTWENIAIHEFGHSAFGLADEYEYWAGCGVDTDRDNHPGPEPTEPNVTIETDPNLIKWKAFIAASTPVPTTENADCSVCDPQGNPYVSQVPGLYEGASYYHCDAFRPVFSCMMRNFADFCPICTQRILDTLAPYQPPNSAPACDAGGPYVAECTGPPVTNVQVNGSGSSDTDCDPITYEWTGGFSGGVAMGSTPILGFAGVGVYPVDLEVEDNENATSQCSTQVTVQDTTPPMLTAPADVEVECSGHAGTPAPLGSPVVSDVCDPAVTVSNDAPALFPLGDTVVTWTAEDASGNQTQAVQMVLVVDTTPPDLSMSVAPTSLWPPNHKLHSIQASIQVSDICDPDPEVRLVSITSNEPDNSNGDGNTTGDIQGANFGGDDRQFQLRAERRGPGSARLYTVSYEAEDQSGNVAAEQAAVSVPKSQGK